MIKNSIIECKVKKGRQANALPVRVVRCVCVVRGKIKPQTSFIKLKIELYLMIEVLNGRWGSTTRNSNQDFFIFCKKSSGNIAGISELVKSSIFRVTM